MAGLRPVCAGTLVAIALALPALVGAQKAPAAVEPPVPVLGGRQDVTAEGPATDQRVAFASALEAAKRARAETIAGAEAAYDRRVSAFESVSDALTRDARRRIEDGPLREARGVLSDSLRLAELRFDQAVREAAESYGDPAVAVLIAADDTIAAVGTDYEVYVAVVDAAEAAFESERARLRSARSTGRWADTGLGAASEARASAGIEAARLTGVHSAEELEDLGRSIRRAALAAIAEIETEVLWGLSSPSIAEAFRAAADAYAQPRFLAFDETLEAIEKEYVEAIRYAETDARATLERAKSARNDLKGLIAAQEGDYRRAVEAADRALQDVVVRYYSKDSSRQETKVGSARRRAASTHWNAIEAALDARREAVSREIPEAAAILGEVQKRLYRPPSRRIYGGSGVDPQDVVQAMRTYKKNRAAVDAKFAEEVADAYLRAQERANAEFRAAAKESAERMRALERTEVVARVVAAAPGRSERLQALEVGIRAALRAAGDGQQSTKTVTATN